MNYNVVRLANPGEVQACACGGGCKGGDSICEKYVKETIANGMVYESGKACQTIRHILEKAQDGFEEGNYYAILNSNTNLVKWGTVYRFNNGSLSGFDLGAYLTIMATSVKPVGTGGRK